MYPQLRQKALRAAGVSPGKTPCCYFAERCRSSDAVGRSVGPSYTTDLRYARVASLEQVSIVQTFHCFDRILETAIL